MAGTKKRMESPANAAGRAGQRAKTAKRGLESVDNHIQNHQLTGSQGDLESGEVGGQPNGRPIAFPMSSGSEDRKRTGPQVLERCAELHGEEQGAGPSSSEMKEILMALAAAAVPVKEPPATNGTVARVFETKRPDWATRDRVVMEHLPLVKAIAVRVHDSLPVHVETDDLIHAGILGLFDAASRYDPSKQVAFSSYAKHRIKGAILDSLRQLDWASRDLRRRHKQVEQITRDLSATLHRNPTEDEVAERMGVEVSRWRQMALDLRNVGLVSASTRASEQEDLPAPDFPTNPDTHPDSMCVRQQLREKLSEAMGVLPERYKKVVRMYYTNEMTMKEIGGVLGINESRVSQIHKSALQKMAVALESNGITSAQAF